MTFTDFARSHGVLVGDLYPADRIRRCATVEHERTKNGAYYWDGRRGWVMAWDGDGTTHWFSGDDKPWSDAEKRAWAAKRHAAEVERRQGYAAAAQFGAEMLKRAAPMEHAYLLGKGLAGIKTLVMPDGEMVVPMRDMQTNALRGLQVIRWVETEPGHFGWEKKMLPRMQAKGAVLRLGPPRAAETWFVEGYATGLSLDLALRQMHLSAAIVISFSDHNMVHVAAEATGPRYCFADNDKSGAGQRAAEAMGVPYCMSDLVGEDANDLHQRAGLMAVCMKARDARSAAMQARRRRPELEAPS